MILLTLLYISTAMQPNTQNYEQFSYETTSRVEDRRALLRQLMMVAESTAATRWQTQQKHRIYRSACSKWPFLDVRQYSTSCRINTMSVCSLLQNSTNVARHKIIYL
jgi:hypothetical protein